MLLKTATYLKFDHRKLKSSYSVFSLRSLQGEFHNYVLYYMFNSYSNIKNNLKIMILKREVGVDHCYKK